MFIIFFVFFLLEIFLDFVDHHCHHRHHHHHHHHSSAYSSNLFFFTCSLTPYYSASGSCCCSCSSPSISSVASYIRIMSLSFHFSFLLHMRVYIIIIIFFVLYFGMLFFFHYSSSCSCCLLLFFFHKGEKVSRPLPKLHNSQICVSWFQPFISYYLSCFFSLLSGPLNRLNDILSLLQPLNHYRAPSAMGSGRITPYLASVHR